MPTYKQQNGKWYYQFMLNGERKHGLCAGASDKKEADSIERATKFKLEQQQNGVIPREEKNVTLNRLWALYDSYARNNKKSYNNDKYTVKIILAYFGGGCIVQKITPAHIEEFKEYLRTKRNVKNATINRYLETLGKIFSIGVDNEIISNNPMRKVSKLREDNHKIRFLSVEEEKRLFTEIEREYEVIDKYTRKKKIIQPYLYLKPIIITALQTGMRRGEIFNLKWSNIDFEYRFIELLDTKSGKARKIPLSDTLENLLNNIEKTSEYVFVNPQTNQPYVDLKHSFTSLMKSAKIENFRFHDLRHTVATRLVEKGIDLLVVKEILGHSNIETTMRYAHPVPKRKREAIDVLNSYTDLHNT